MRGDGAQLTRLYADLNTRLFQGRLPTFRVTLVASLPRSKHGECLQERRLIRVRWGRGPAAPRRVLLHEMCHIGTPHHGRRFQAKLLRLAAQGEAWAIEEAEVYRSAPSWNQEMANLRDGLLNFVVECPGLRFSSVVRALAGDLGLRQRELLLRAPWLPAAWKSVKKEHERSRRIREAAQRRGEQAI